MTFGSIARALNASSCSVEVLTGFPNYPDGVLAPGYRLRHYQREVLDGVVVHRAPLFPSHDDRAVRRIANYLSFASAASLVGLAKLARRDVNLVVPSPPTVVLPALVLKWWRGVPYGLHIHDLWPESMFAAGILPSGLNAIAARILHAICNLAYRHAEFIAVISPGVKEVLVDRGVPEHKIHFVPNWADETRFRVQETEGSPLGYLTVMYAGSVGEPQGLEVLVEAAHRLRRLDHVRFVVVGTGPALDALRRDVTSRGLANVSFRPPVGSDLIADVMAEADVQLISLRDLPLFRHTMPSKVQTILATGSPFVAAVAGDAAEVLAASGGGRVVAPGDAAGLAQAIRELADMPPEQRRELGLLGRGYYERTFGATMVAARLTGLLLEASRARVRNAMWNGDAPN